MPLSPAQSLAIEDFAEFSDDPLGFVLFSFPWGEPTSELAVESGPQTWQRQVLEEMGQHIRGGLGREAAFRKAVASGHGIGKSALVSWIMLWAIATLEDTRGVVTANTQDQLRTKTWAELSKWYRLFIGRQFFKLTATRLCSADPDHSETWRIDQGTWTADNTEAFAGLHNKGKRILCLYDEASGIDDAVWDVTNGALTDRDTEILWLAFGNPTRNGTRFAKCFAADSRWRPQRIDSRTVAITNKLEIDGWIADHGLNSDYVRVRVLGEFPLASSMEFIGLASIQDAQRRPLTFDPDALDDALVLGVDVARQGEDSSVIFFRKGLDARSIPPVVVREPNLMTLAGIVLSKIQEHRADGVFIDEGGIGAGLVDRLRQLGAVVQGVQFGARADLPAREGEGLYLNKRSEMYGSTRRWLKGGGLLPQSEQLERELNAPLYSVNDKDQIVLERKRDIKARLGFSPDMADGLVLTFAYPVFSLQRLVGAGKPLLQIDYDPLEMAENI